MFHSSRTTRRCSQRLFVFLRSFSLLQYDLVDTGTEAMTPIFLRNPVFAFELLQREAHVHNIGKKKDKMINNSMGACTGGRYKIILYGKKPQTWANRFWRTRPKTYKMLIWVTMEMVGWITSKNVIADQRQLRCFRRTDFLHFGRH